MEVKSGGEGGGGGCGRTFFCSAGIIFTSSSSFSRRSSTSADTTTPPPPAASAAAVAPSRATDPLADPERPAAGARDFDAYLAAAEAETLAPVFERACRGRAAG